MISLNKSNTKCTVVDLRASNSRPGFIITLFICTVYDSETKVFWIKKFTVIIPVIKHLNTNIVFYCVIHVSVLIVEHVWNLWLLNEEPSRGSNNPPLDQFEVLEHLTVDWMIFLLFSTCNTLLYNLEKIKSIKIIALNFFYKFELDLN